jgi:hypothetical protein
MTELLENNMKKLEPEIMIEKGEIKSLLFGINRCTERLERLIELKAPMAIIAREIRMIQYRALSVLSSYEAFALLNFVYKEETPPAQNEVEK